MSAAENQIQADIEALKVRFTNTQELYREVAAVLFFRYGLTPTANKLYQLVRKGSMSAPAEALNRFWADLREKSRVRVEAPDLPESLAAQAGEVVAALWEQAQIQARDSLRTLRQEIESQLVVLQAGREAAIASAESATNEGHLLKQQVGQLEARAISAEEQLSKEISAKAVIEAQLATSLRETDSLKSALAEARQDFSRELEKTRSMIALTENRAVEDRNRLLLEIDRERGLASKTQQELSATKSAGLKQLEKDRALIVQQQTEISELREGTGNLQGQLVQLTRQQEHVKLELEATRALLTKTNKISPQKVRRTPSSQKRDAKLKSASGKSELT